MKKDIIKFADQYLVCQQVKIEHQKPGGQLQPLEISKWKWEHIAMDFVVGLPRTPSGKNAIWVIVDRLTKSAHFLSYRFGLSMEDMAKRYVNEIVKLHGVPVSIVSDRDPRFVSNFWKSLQGALGTKLNLSTAFHPQTDGQSERTIQTLEDMLRSCIIDFGGSWDEHLYLAEFSYNNNYHSSIKMARKCRSPIFWDDVGEKRLTGSDFIQQSE